MSTYFNYKSYKNLGIGTELMHFFYMVNGASTVSGKPDALTLHDFLDNCPEHHRKLHKNLGLVIRTLCQGLIEQGQLFSVGFNPEQQLPYSEKFASYFFIEELADYGSYDFTALGFPEVVGHFKSSVIRMNVGSSFPEMSKSGTCFLLDRNLIATAAHCIPAHSIVSIEGWDLAKAPLKSIKMFGRDGASNPFRKERSLIDLALLEFESDPFPNAPKFQLWGGGILEDILVMGYPSVSGFNEIQLALAGQIISEHESYNRKQPMMLVDTRVKGGNSGGPVINRFGKVTGVITDAEFSSEMAYDSLGYALATPAQTLLNLIQAVKPLRPVDPYENYPEPWRDDLKRLEAARAKAYIEETEKATDKIAEDDAVVESSKRQQAELYEIPFTMLEENSIRIGAR